MEKNTANTTAENTKDAETLAAEQNGISGWWNRQGLLMKTTVGVGCGVLVAGAAYIGYKVFGDQGVEVVTDAAETANDAAEVVSSFIK